MVNPVRRLLLASKLKIMVENWSSVERREWNYDKKISGKMGRAW